MKINHTVSVTPANRYCADQTRGSLLDWVKANTNIKWTFAFDLLPPIDSEDFLVGPSVPPTAIMYSGNQVLDAIGAMLEDIKRGPVLDPFESYGRDEETGDGTQHEEEHSASQESEKSPDAGYSERKEL